MLVAYVRRHSGTLALETEDFSKTKSVVLVKREDGFTKTRKRAEYSFGEFSGVWRRGETGKG